MRTFLLFITFVLSFSLIISDAQAKRFGGGRSFGMTRSISSFIKPQTNNFTRQNSYANANNAAPNRLLGALGGLAVGSLLATLFMGHGMGNGLISWLILGGFVLFVVTVLRNRRQQNMQFQSNHQPFQSHRASFQHFQGEANGTSNQTIDFNVDEFLRDAKAKFLRLQTAYDQKNLNDIREFSTPEVCAEIQLQFQERGDTNNLTEVVTIDAELIDVITEAKTVASVQFSGLIREDGHKVAATFDEIWHFVKDGNRWLVAGIQQN